jgi:hypothetical protein
MAAFKTTPAGRTIRTGVVEGKATAARRDAEFLAKQAGQTPAQVKQAGLDARTAVDPRLASTEVRYAPGGAGGSGGGLVGMTWSTVPNAKKPAASTATTASTSTSNTSTPAYDPTPLTISGAEGYEMPEIKFPEMAPQMFAPGGAGAGVDGNAAGFRRKKSSARMAGMTSKGTGQFKITGQSGKSSGLNIGA